MTPLALARALIQQPTQPLRLVKPRLQESLDRPEPRDGEGRGDLFSTPGWVTQR